MLGHENTLKTIWCGNTAPKIIPARGSQRALVLEAPAWPRRRSARRLVGRHDDALHHGRLMDQPRRRNKDAMASAVGIGDHAVALGKVIAVRPGTTSGLFEIHAESRAGYHDDDAARRLGGRHRLRGCAAGAPAEEKKAMSPSRRRRRRLSVPRRPHGLPLNSSVFADQARPRRGEA